MGEADFHIQACGRLLMTSVDGRLVLPTARKARAVLAVVALSADGSCSRTKLANILWEDANEAAANNCLRQALHQLARAFAAFDRSPLTITREFVQLDRRRCTIDLLRFGPQSCEPALEPEDIFRIDPETLLEDLESVSPGFDEWLLCERAKLRARLENEIDRQLDVALRTEAFASQRYAVAREISIRHPAMEKASRAAISSLMEMGETALALREYERCRDVLRRDFDAKPSSQTQALYAQLRSSSSCKPRAVVPQDISTLTSAGGRPSVAILGDLDTALKFLQDASARLDAAGNWENLEIIQVIGAPAYLAMCHALRGETETARLHLNNALMLSERSDHPTSRAFALSTTARVTWLLGDVDRDREICDELATLYRKHGFRYWLANAECYLGWHESRDGRGMKAAERVYRALDEYRATKARWLYPFFLSIAAEVDHAHGRLRDGLGRIDAALQQSADTAECWYDARLLRLKATLLSESKEAAGAEQCRVQARQLIERQGSRLFAF